MRAKTWGWMLPGLYTRVLSALVVSIVLVLGVFTTINTLIIQDRLRDGLLENGRRELRILTQTASVYMAQNDAHQLILTAKAVTEGGQPLFVAFYDPDGALIAAAGAPSASNEARRGFGDLPQRAQASGAEQLYRETGFLEVVRPIVYQGEPAGTLAVRLSDEAVRTELQREIFEGALTATLLAIILSLVVGLLLRSFIILPLRRLTTEAEQISTGSWIVPAGHDRSDDFGRLARSFGTMLQALQSREHQLQEQVAAVQSLNTVLDSRVAERTRKLQDLVGNQQQLLAQIRDMSMPVVPVLEGVIVMPIIGTLDSARTSQLIQSLLTGIEQFGARLAVLDITGATMIDEQVATTIVRAADASRLLGATTVLVGVRPEVAQTLVQLHVDLSAIRAHATLQEVLQPHITRPKRVVAST